MTRLIDATALRAWFENHSVYDEFPVGYIMGLIDEQPTVEPTLYGYKIEHLALTRRGWNVKAIAGEVKCSPQTVRNWQKKFKEEGKLDMSK